MKFLLPAASILFLTTACSEEPTPVDANAPSDASAPNASAAETVAPGSTPTAQTPTNAPTSQPASRPVSPTAVAVTVNGTEILEQDVDEQVRAMASAQMGGRPIPDQFMGQMRDMLRPQALQAAVQAELMNQAIAKEGVSVTEEERIAEYDRDIQAYLVRAGSTREELSEQIQMAEGIDLDAFIKREAAKEVFGTRCLELKLLNTAFPERSKVTDEDVAARYEERLEDEYTKPEEVRASHILLGTDQMSEEEAKAKADEVLALCRAEGADFAALAKEHSTGPSGPTGGDLNFFPRHNRMVEPFAAAAFELEVDGISEPVKTQFGYHIIKVTDRREARVVPLEEADYMIRGQMRLEKASELRGEYIAKLEEDAEIVYPE